MSTCAGYWSTHKYQRHSVGRDIALTGFIGWSKFTEILDSAKNDRDRKLVLAAFKLGGRIGEVLLSDFSMFSVQTSPENGQEYLLCNLLPLSKRWKKIGSIALEGGKHKLITEKVPAFRTFALPLKDSVEFYSEEFAKFALSQSQGLLFPSPFSKRHGKPISVTRAYQIVRYEIGQPLNIYLYNHLLRAWRASQLRREKNFAPDDLMEFFKWRDYDTALMYAQKGVWGIAQRFT